MAENTQSIHIAENSREQIAYKLMKDIANAEAMVFHKDPGQGYQSANRKWILDTYVECLEAVKGIR